MSGHQPTCVRRLLATVAAAGVQDVVIAPGSRSTPLVQAAAERPDLRCWPVLDERTAAFVALGLGRAGRPAAVICTSGSAVAHLLPACVEAAESATPLLVLSADRPAAVRGLGAPQAIVQPGLLAPPARWLVEVDCVEGVHTSDAFGEVLDHLRWALAGMRERGGVVHANVPLDLPLALPEGPPETAQPMTAPADPDGPPVPPPEPGERVLVLAGPLAHDPDLLAWLADVPPRTGVAVLAELPSNLALPGMFRRVGAALRDPDLRARLRPDRIVRLGEWPTGKGAQLLLEDAGRLGLPVDVVEPGRRSDPLRQNRLQTALPPALALEAWHDAPLPTDEVLAWRDAWFVAEEAAAQVAIPEGFWEAPLVQGLAGSLPDGADLVLGNSMPIRDWDAFAPALGPEQAVWTSRGANGIDGTLATALGLHLGSGRRTAVYLGDAAFLHDVGSLQAVAQLAPAGALRVVVADNDGGAIFDHLPAAAQIEPEVHRRFFTQPHGRDLGAIARAFGLTAVEVDSEAGLARALAYPWAQLPVIVAKIDRALSHRLHQELQGRRVAAARAALGLPVPLK